jgi:hypothetical protein
METIIINNENYRLGVDTAISLGYNMKGNYIITKSILTMNNDELICLNGGIKIRIEKKHINDFFLDTKENRKKLKEQINGFY